TVPYRREWVGLHQWHVLVRRGVEDDARLVALENLVHLRAVADIGEHGDGSPEAAFVDQLSLDLEEGGLAELDQDQPLRSQTRQLAAELGADRATGACDEHGLALDVRRGRVEVDVDRLATEAVFDLDRPDLGGEGDL